MNIKKIIAFITSSVLGIAMPISFQSQYLGFKSITVAADDESENTYDSWQEAYHDFLNEFTSSSSYSSKNDTGSDMCSTYAVHDMNNDGIPELFINYQPITASASALYTFYDSKVVKLMTLPRAGFVSYCEEDGLIESSGGGGAGGYVYTTYSKIIDDEIVAVDSFMVSASTVPSTYSRNGVTISESEYNSAINQYQKKKWTNVGRENYFDDLLYKYEDIYYSYYFDHYEAYLAFPSSSTLSIANTVNGIPVTRIGKYLLSETDVKTLNIPANITGFYYNGLNGAALTTINVDSNNKYYTSVDGVMYSKDMSQLVKFPTAKDISTYSFPKSIESIGRFAFAWCSRVNKIVVPKQIWIIEDYSFYCCQNLSSITFLGDYFDIYDKYLDGNGITICNTYDSTTGKGNYLGVIYGYEDSSAQQYAENFDRTFISLGPNPDSTTTTTTTSTTTTTTTTKTTTTTSTTTSTTAKTTTTTSFASTTTTKTTAPNTTTTTHTAYDFRYSIVWQVQTVTAAPGEEVDIDVLVIDSNNLKLELGGAQFVMSCDAELIGGTGSEAYWTAIDSFVDGEANKFAFSHPKGMGLAANNKAKVITLKYKIPENAKEGDKYPVRITQLSASDTNGLDCTKRIICVDGAIRVVGSGKASTKYGDANCDNKVSIADAVAILQHLGNRDKYELKSQGISNADVDGIAGVTAKDAFIIQQVDAGIYKPTDLPLRGLCEKISVNLKTVIKTLCCERLENSRSDFFTVYNGYCNLSRFFGYQPAGMERSGMESG